MLDRVSVEAPVPDVMPAAATRARRRPAPERTEPGALGDRRRCDDPFGDSAAATSRVQRSTTPTGPPEPTANPPGDRIQRAALPPITRSSPGVIRRANAFYHDQPKSETKPSPLATISDNLAADAGVKPEELRKHWVDGSTLKIAKTAKTHLTAGSMQTIQRPTEAAAWLDTPNPNPGTRKDPAWITDIGNLGTVEDQVQGDAPQKYNGGHLIAWEFLNAAANVQGNIAPQSALQNQALFRRIERALEHTVHVQNGTGIEISVSTPYNHDNYTVTYRQLFERDVLTDPQLFEELDARKLLDKSLTFAQMAPDVYSVHYLTQTGTTSMVPADKREKRENIQSFVLPDYSEDTSNAMIAQEGLPKLSILATNYNPQSGDQEVAAFAHVVYLNHRSRAAAVTPLAEETTPEELKRRRSIALGVMNDYPQLSIFILDALQTEFGLSPTAANEVLVQALMESEPPDVPATESMDTDEMDLDVPY